MTVTAIGALVISYGCPPLARGSETAQRQALPPDQHALHAQHGGGRKGVKRGGGPHPAPGSKAARRAAAAAAAAQLAALPAAASGDYLDAYPTVKQLMQRFKNRGIEKFPLGVLNEYAARLMLQVTFHSEQASQAGGFRVEARLTNKRGDETVETGTGLARNKQTGKQLAAAALLERLLETTVDEEQLLDPNAGKPAEDKRKKYGQVQVKPGLGADPSAASFSSSRFGRSSSYGSFGGYGAGGYAAALAHRRRAGGFGGSPGFVRGGALVPSSDGAGMELRPSPGSAAAQGRYGAAAVTPSSGYRPPSLTEQLSRFQVRLRSIKLVRGRPPCRRSCASNSASVIEAVAGAAAGTGRQAWRQCSSPAAPAIWVGFTYWHCTEPDKLCCTAVQGFKVNLATGEGLDECLEALTAGGKRLVAVINCAALSQPAVCEAHPEAAAALNVPTKLLDALERHKAAKGCDPLLIHFSTDQVYDGSKARWKEDDDCKPVNVYGRTKLDGERAVQARWPNHAILRSSIIYGPDPPLVEVERPLLLQFIDESLTAKRPTAFFDDEWRCPVRVRDIIRVVQTLIARQGELQHRLFNLGGPDRLSRADMAEAVARAHGHDPALVQRLPAASAASRSEAAAVPRKRGGSQPSPVPDVDAQQLLHTLGLDFAAEPAALLRKLRKLTGVRQQGVLDNAAAVAAHLLSPAVGLTAQQAGQLLERCPVLFSWPPERRAAVLFGQLMAVGLTAEAAAMCFAAYPPAAHCTTYAPGLAEMADILAHSENREGSPGKPAAQPAAQRTVAALLTHSPRALQLVSWRAKYLQRRAAELQQAGYTAGQVAAVAWEHPVLFGVDTAGKMAADAAVLQQELGLKTAQLDSLSARRPPRWRTASSETVRTRAAALAKAFGREAAAAAFMHQPEVLSCPPALWQRNLCGMAACGVADPNAVLLHRPQLLYKDHAAPSFLQRRLLLQRAFRLTAAQLFEGHSHRLDQLEPPAIVQRLQFVEQHGQAHRLVAKAKAGRKPAAASAEDCQPALSLVAVTGTLQQYLAAVGASQAEWEAWTAANPPAAIPLYGWAQQAAEEEAARLAAALPPELQPAAAADGAALARSGEADVLG
ncbi:hypothetical protein COHA_009899 [Chlorella ohadii]|uniref:DRBM domain-containing protein n=1 Tax=Chlorella ohadii TaxID=2649997 RepID=A0AAD5DH47_9CHLO|nr:hypothetical protein COHA_009899 [Chlorella ohadii]